MSSDCRFLQLFGAIDSKMPIKSYHHAGCNDALEKKPQVILDELLQLKHHIELQLPGIKVTISCPVMRIVNSTVRLKCGNYARS